jgi:CrcB protein
MPPFSWIILGLVALGGAVGTGARYLIAWWSFQRFGPGFPIGTMAVNIVGSALLGLAVAMLIEPAGQTATARWRSAFVAIGFFGGFTTFSTFSMDALNLALKDRWGAAVFYITATVFTSLAAAAAGYFIGRWVRGD